MVQFTVRAAEFSTSDAITVIGGTWHLAGTSSPSVHDEGPDRERPLSQTGWQVLPLGSESVQSPDVPDAGATLASQAPPVSKTPEGGGLKGYGLMQEGMGREGMRGRARRRKA